MRVISHRVLPLAVAVAVCIVGRANAGGHCVRCGRDEACQKVCRLVVEEKKVDVVCWGTKCEDFCVPGPSKPGCRNCELVCETSDASCTGPHTATKKFVSTEWIPGSAAVHTKKKLMKKTVTKKVPSHKWVVENLYSQCEANAVGPDIQPGVAVSTSPVVGANLKNRSTAAVANH
jgi:hypothetical protein